MYKLWSVVYLKLCWHTMFMIVQTFKDYKIWKCMQL